MISCSALSIGPAASLALSGAVALRVHSAFPSVLNLELEGSGRLVSLRAVRGGGLPHEVVLDRAEALEGWELSAGARAEVTEGAIRLPAPSGILVVDLRGAARLPRRTLPPIVHLGAAHRACTQDLAARQEGCELRIDALRRECGAATAMGERLRGAALDLAAAARGPLMPLRRAVAALVGLGPGLTPAGDDFLCGLLAAARAADPALITALGDAVEASLGRTTSIGAFLLRWAVEGFWPTALVDLAEGLAGEREAEALAGLAELCQLGHSSGCDLATGFLFGLGSLVPPA